MRILRTVAELREELRPARRREATIGLVPTMGFLHEGHLSLLRQARAECDVVVLSLFVNPTQFNQVSDLATYPRDEARDAELAAAAGVDVLFAPAADEVYPADFSTSVQIAGRLTETLEGAQRGAGHFHGVTTVVTKLLAMCQPDVAYFGQKDAQQSVLVRQLVRDLDLPVRIEVCPTVRAPDGLAMSSRNVRLDDVERKRALALRHGLDTAEQLVRSGTHDVAAIRVAAIAAMADLEVEPEYFELVEPATLAPITTVDDVALVVVAAWVGDTRLIDNTVVRGNGRVA